VKPEKPELNRILAALSVADRTLLRPDLEAVDLPLRYRLAEANQKISSAFFIETGMASTTTHVKHQVPIEIGVTGREGVANLPFIMGSDRAPSETFMQIGGVGLRIPSEALRDAMRKSETLTATLLRSTHVFLVQVSSTVLANGRATISERLARWLLMARDRVDEDAIGLTHEFLAIMLGVQRPGVTVALRDFERRGLVLGARALITILDREGLETAANGYYGSAESEFQRLFGRAG